MKVRTSRRIASSTPIERRILTSVIERRAAGDGDQSIGFTGHAAVFGKRTWIGPPKWGFWESVRKGAFAKTIAEADVRMLFNHDENYPLARSTITSGPGSLRLSEDDTGLVDEADMVPTTYARDLALSIDAGVVNQQSISFLPVVEEWSIDEETGEETRELIEVQLFDVSPVTFPAFTETDASLRSFGINMLFDALHLDNDENRSAILAGIRSGSVNPALTPALRAARTALDALVETGEPETPPLDPATPDPHQHRTERARRAFAILRTQMDAAEAGGKNGDKA